MVRNPLELMKVGVAVSKAAEAFAQWIAVTGTSVDDLRARLDRGDAVLQEALSHIRHDDLERYRSMVQGLLALVTPDDYPLVLRALAKNFPQYAAHAQLLSTPEYYWRHWKPAMDEVRAYFGRG